MREVKVRFYLGSLLCSFWWSGSAAFAQDWLRILVFFVYDFWVFDELRLWVLSLLMCFSLNLEYGFCSRCDRWSSFYTEKGFVIGGWSIWRTWGVWLVKLSDWDFVFGGLEIWVCLRIEIDRWVLIWFSFAEQKWKLFFLKISLLLCWIRCYLYSSFFKLGVIFVYILNIN